MKFSEVVRAVKSEWLSIEQKTADLKSPRQTINILFSLVSLFSAFHAFCCLHVFADVFRFFLPREMR